MSKGKTFTWNDRLTLINHYKPSDEQACQAFGITQPELDVARNQLKAGVFSLSGNLDVASYSDLFPTTADSTDDSDTTVTTTTAPVRVKATVTSTKAAPETASKTVREPKKRGRKGDKITQAFAAIPDSPTPAEEFAKTHGVSIAVLRQSKRFDPTASTGIVRVKKDKTSKALMIWREQA